MEFFHKPLRLQLAHLELKGTQDDQKHVYTLKLSPNQKIRIMTTLHQFRDRAARYFDRESDSETVKNELLMFEPKFQKLTLEKTGTYTANPTNCSRAEELLIALISLWMTS